MLDLFTALPPDVRVAKLAAYRQFLLARDGVMDIQKRTLSRREQSMARFEVVPARPRELARSVFDEQYAKFDPKRSTPAEVMLLLALTKINAGEAYGVDVTFDKAIEDAVAKQDDLELNLLIEETYHTRILLSAACMYGMKVDNPYTPPLSLRIMINALAITPRAVARTIGTCGEIVVALLLTRMLEIARSVLKHDPELSDAIEERIMDVLVDEIGHVSFNRLNMGSAGLKQTRALLPIVARGLSSAIPELGALGASPHDCLDDIARFANPGGFPEEVRRQAFFA